MQEPIFPEPGRFARLSRIVERWHRPEGLRRLAAPALVGGLFALVAAIVYATGGTKFAHAHLFYVPILLSAFCFGLPGGIAGGIVAGLLAGPLMPLDVAAGISQSAANWLSRAGYFTLIGALAGVLCSLMRGQFETIRRLGYFDPLTGLPNKVALREDLAAAIRSNRALAVIRLQVAGFEDINAGFGYRTADALLQAVARRIASPPAGVRIYHLYAAHFGILYPAPGEHGPEAVARDLLAGLKAPFLVNGVPICIESRVGLARCPEHAAETHALLRAASFALYDAEVSAHEIRTYDPGKHEEQQHSIRLVADLQRGLDQRQLRLVYQPKVSIGSGACIGLEALARWDHPVHGTVPPQQFTAIAEKTTLVKPFTEWVLRSALEQLAAWRRNGLEVAVAVNVSVRNLEEAAFPELLRALMAGYGIGPDWFELEVTERAVMAHPQQVLTALERLKELRIRISIDDFGTGQSSLAYLKELPVDAIKIDQCFVRRLADEPKNRKIVRAAIDLAHDMDLQVVAEGVQTSEAYDYLATFGCDMAQGYFICRPLEAADLEPWLSRSSPAPQAFGPATPQQRARGPRLLPARELAP